MDYFKYKAQDENGKVVSGTMQANTEADLHEKLKAEKKLLISSTVIKKSNSAKRLRADKVAEFARNIGKLVGAGVSLVRSLKIISEDESIKPKERKVYAEILRLVRSGITLSEALEAQGDVFPPLFVNMIKSSEASGNLDKVAMEMAEYYDKEFRLNQKLSSAMTYPKILCVLIVIVVAIIMGFVMPQFKSLFDQMESLPKATTVLLAISDFVKYKWYIIIIVCVIAYMAWTVLTAIPAVKYQLHKLEIKLPGIGKLRKVIYSARFARTLSSLYSAGIPIVTCLSIAKSTIGNVYIEKQFDKVVAMVREGGNLSEAVDSVDGFVKKLSSSIMVGEETGSLDTMLVSLADQMSYESEMAMQKLVAMVEPAMIVVMAVIVGFIMIAVIQPIYGSYEAIANQAE